MTATINASTSGGGGIIQTADSSGILALQTGGTTALTINGSQNVSIGTSSPVSGRKLTVDSSGSDSAVRINAPTGYSAYLELTENSSLSNAQYWQIGKTPTTHALQFWNGTEKMRLDSNGNLGLGVTPSAFGAGYKGFEIGAVGNALTSVSTAVNLSTNAIRGSSWTYGATGRAVLYQQDTGSGNHGWYNAPSGTAGTAITFTQAMTLDASGNLLIGDPTVTTVRLFAKSAASGTALLLRGSSDQRLLQVVDGTTSSSPSATSAIAYLERFSASSRSLNASGTLNASGADYAEYMTKAGDFTVAKGDVVGINAEGKLTNVFADAVSFVVKSTDPSLVGGDVWGTEEALGMTRPAQPSEDASDEDKAQYETDKAAFDATLEAARQAVDRVAFAGQVPVNVTGATAGQYIIPVNDNGSIKGEAVSNPTFEQYQQAVGKVIAIEQDGRARIIVKVA